MARLQNNVITLRLDDREKEIIRDFAARYGMTNKQGEPNLSAAARALLFLALQHGAVQTIQDVHLANARAEWLELVNAGWRRMMKELTEIGSRGV